MSLLFSFLNCHSHEPITATLPAKGPSLILLTDCWWQWTVDHRVHDCDKVKHSVCVEGLNYRMLSVAWLVIIGRTMLKIATIVTISPTWCYSLTVWIAEGRSSFWAERRNSPWTITQLHSFQSSDVLFSISRICAFSYMYTHGLCTEKTLSSPSWKKKKISAQHTLDSLGLLQCTYWQLWIPCCVFSVLCPEYNCSSEVHLGRRAPSVWVLMKEGPQSRQRICPTVTHTPAFIDAGCFVTRHSQQLHCFHWLLQRRPSHLAAIQPLRVHIALLGARRLLPSLVRSVSTGNWKVSRVKFDPWVMRVCRCLLEPMCGMCAEHRGPCNNL